MQVSNDDPSTPKLPSLRVAKLDNDGPSTTETIVEAGAIETPTPSPPNRSRDASFATFLSATSTKNQPTPTIPNPTPLSPAPIKPTNDNPIEIDLSKEPIRINKNNRTYEGSRDDNFVLYCSIGGNDIPVKGSYVTFRLNEPSRPGLHSVYVVYLDQLRLDKTNRETAITEILSKLDLYIQNQHPRFRGLPKVLIERTEDFRLAFENASKPKDNPFRNEYEWFTRQMSIAWFRLNKLVTALKKLDNTLDDCYGISGEPNRRPERVDKGRITIFECLASVYEPNYAKYTPYDKICELVGPTLNQQVKEVANEVTQFYNFLGRNFYTKEDISKLEKLGSKMELCSLTDSQSDKFFSFRIFVLSLMELYKFLPCFIDIDPLSQDVDYFVQDVRDTKYKLRFDNFYSEDNNPIVLTPTDRNKMHSAEWRLLLDDRDPCCSQVHTCLKGDFDLNLQELVSKDDGFVLGEKIDSLKNYGIRNGLFTISTK